MKRPSAIEVILGVLLLSGLTLVVVTVAQGWSSGRMAWHDLLTGLLFLAVAVPLLVFMRRGG